MTTDRALGTMLRGAVGGALLALAACATAPRPSTAGSVNLRATATPLGVALPPTVTSRNSFVLDGSSLRAYDGRSLLELVDVRWPGVVSGELPRGAGLRLSPADAGTGDRFGVYDSRGAFLGGPELLESMHAASVRQLRRLTETEERSAFGHGHPAGAIVVTWNDGHSS